MKRFVATYLSDMKVIFTVMVAFGLLMGLIFPLIVDPFVTWNPDRKLYFRIACLAAGLAVGSFCFLIIKISLYKQKMELEKAKDEFTVLTEAAIKKRHWGFHMKEDKIPTCWKIKGCDDIECPVHGEENMRCWLIAGTLCDGGFQGKFAQKLKSCTTCEVYRKTVNHEPIMEIRENFNSLMMVVHEREEQLAEANKKLKEMSVTDSLTGLKNHGFFQEQLRHEIARAQRYSRSLSLIMIDLDHFKRVNDSFGHPAGDRVLKCVGRFLTDETREMDLVARYGGEEFIIIMPDTDGPSAAAAAEKLRLHIKQNVPCEAELSPSYVGASFGVADYPACAPDPDGIIRAADSALLYSKRNGRNRVTYYTKEKPLREAG